MDDLSDDLHATLRELQGSSNDNLPAIRQSGQVARSTYTDEPRQAARDVEVRREESSRRESLPANREPDEEDTTEQERRDLTTEGSEKRDDKVPTVIDPLDKPPVTWKEPAKKDWAKLPKEVRQDILRRERQIDLALTQTADQRRYADSIYNAIAPYEAHLRAEGANHVQAVDHLMRMAHVMRAGTPQDKAKTLSNLFFAHSVDLELLDKYITAGLEGKPAQVSDPILQALEQKLAPVTQFMQEMQQIRNTSTQRVQAGAAQTLQQLTDDPDIGDLVDDVRQDMADLLELASKRGAILPLRDAAIRAIMAHPEHSIVYNQRQLAKQAQQHTDNASRSRRAGASLQDEGAPPASESDESDGSVLGDLMSSVRELSRRR